MWMVLPKDRGLLLWLWSSFLHSLQGERTQVRCLGEINLLQQKKVCPRLAVPFYFLLRFFFSCLLSPPGIYLFSALDFDAENNCCLQAAGKQFLLSYVIEY